MHSNLHGGYVVIGSWIRASTILYISVPRLTGEAVGLDGSLDSPVSSLDPSIGTGVSKCYDQQE